MRITLAWAAASFSVRDVTTGLRSALLRAGHQIRDYRLDNRLELISRAFPPEVQKEKDYEIARMATENILAEATYHQADLVLIISGLWFHEIGLWLLQHYRIPTAIVLTESPYEDEAQRTWLSRYPEVMVFTHERVSAATHGWHYLPHAYDPEVHRPVEPDPDEACDVLMVGTGFPERQALLEQVNWDGISLRLRGLWPTLTDASPLFPFYLAGCVRNADVPKLYAAAKVNLNPYRNGVAAESLNPRAYELAACGAFQVSDERAESRELFGNSVPTYRDAAELERMIRYYLKDEPARKARADEARRRVQGQTFDQRVQDLIGVVEGRIVATVQ